MSSKEIAGTTAGSEGHVVVGSCFGLAVLRPDELAGYYRGYACFAARAFVVALLGAAMLTVGH